MRRTVPSATKPKRFISYSHTPHRQTFINTSWLLPCLLVKTTQEGLNPDLWHSAFHSQTDQSTLTDTNSCTRLTALVTDRRKETKTTVQRRRSGIRKKEEGVCLH